MDVAATASAYSTADVLMKASTMVLKNSMDATEQIAGKMINELLNLDVGPKEEHIVDMYV